MPNTLANDQSLLAGQELTSLNGRFHLIMQGDGNLVAYDGNPTVSSAYWASHTNFDYILYVPSRASEAKMQGDGNFVLYSQSPAPWFPIWSTGTNGHNGARIDMQDDGNIVVYDAGGNNPVWASHTVRSQPPDQPPAPRPAVTGQLTTEVGAGKEMNTSVTLYRNGGLAIDVDEKCWNWVAGFRGQLFVLVIDAGNNSIYVSQNFTCTTRGSVWDVSTSSYGHDNFYQKLPDEIGKYAESVQILQMDVLPGPDLAALRDSIIEGIKTAGTIIAELAPIIAAL